MKTGIIALIVIGIGVMVLLSRPFAQDVFSGSTGITPDKMELYCGSSHVDGDVKDIEGYELKPGEEYRLSGKVNFDGEKADAPYLFLTINHDWFRVELDGEEIASYMEDDVDSHVRSSSPGNSYIPVPLGKDCLGKTLDVYFYPVLGISSECHIPHIFYGDYAATARGFYKEDLLTNAMTITFIVMALLLMVFSFSLPRSGETSRLWHLGMFSLMLGIYNYTESLYNITVLANPYLSYMINFIFFALIPVPLLMFYRHDTSGWTRRLFNILIWAGFISIGLQSVLHFSGIRDYRELLWMSHIFYFAAFSFSFVSILRMKDASERKCLLLGIVFIITGLLLDAVSFYGGIHFLRGNTPFMKAGIIVMVIMEIKYLSSNITKLYRDSIKAQFYRERAMTDDMTGMGNRNAFNAEMEAVKKGEKKCDDIICAVLDLNGLKKINDDKGHRAGDAYIKGAAEDFMKYMEPYGKVFRTGGDEFTAFFYDAPREDLRRDLAAMRKDLEEKGISYASGLSACEGRTLEECLEEADRRMYSNKRKNK